MKRLLSLVLAVAADVCSAVEPTPIQITDPSVLQPSLQIEINMHGGPERHVNHAIEIGYTSGRGSATQTLDSGFVEVSNGKRFNAPTTLRYDFEMNHLQVNYRWRHFVGGGAFGYEAIIGGAFNQLRFSVHSPTDSDDVNLAAPFLTYGAGLLYVARPGTRVHLRATGHYFEIGGEDAQIGRIGLFLEQQVFKHFLVRAGYSSWWLRGNFTPESSVRADFRGPALGLEVTF